MDLLLRKNEGKLNGWISYTLSKSEQQTPGRTAELELTMVNEQFCICYCHYKFV
jgi:hypothetical protein